MLRKVFIHENVNSGVIKISSRPEGFAIPLFIASLIGICALLFATNVFHYGFSHWGPKQQEIWDKFNRILKDKGIPNLTPKKS